MAISKRKKAQYRRIAVYVLSAIALLAMVLVVDWGRLQSAMFQWDIVVEQFPDILTGAAKNTIIFTILGFAGGISFGLLFALMRLSAVRPYRWFAATYIEIFRGIPLLVTLLILGFGIPIATGWRWPNPYLQGAVPLALVASAYMAETIRAGIEAVPKGQMEAARS
jgi:polar amino acid transport system permease protein